LIHEESVEVKLNKEDSKRFSISGHEYGLEQDFYIIHLDENMPENEEMIITMRFDIILKLAHSTLIFVFTYNNNFISLYSFTSYLSNDLAGFYRSSYEEEVTARTFFKFSCHNIYCFIRSQERILIWL